MNVTNYYPVLGSANVPAAQRFYEQHFGFAPAFEADWYAHLQHPLHEHLTLAIVDRTHTSVPAAGRTPAAGLLLNIEVDDVDEEYARLTAAGVGILLELRDEPWGQRHFIVDAPDGVMVDVVKPIPPAEEFAADYVDDAAATR